MGRIAKVQTLHINIKTQHRLSRVNVRWFSRTMVSVKTDSLSAIFSNNMTEEDTSHASI